MDRRAAATLICASCLAAAAGAQSAAAPSESAVKAAFLLKFGAFVTWPAGSAPTDAAYTVAVLGDDAVTDDLEALARQASGPRISVKRIREQQLPSDAHVVFIGFTSQARLADAIERATGPRLVVTQAPAGIEAGAVLNFVIVEGRVRFEASREAAARRGLQLSSRLLALSLNDGGRPWR